MFLPYPHPPVIASSEDNISVLISILGKEYEINTRQSVTTRNSVSRSRGGVGWGGGESRVGQDRKD